MGVAKNTGVGRPAGEVFLYEIIHYEISKLVADVESHLDAGEVELRIAVLDFERAEEGGASDDRFLDDANANARANARLNASLER